MNKATLAVMTLSFVGCAHAAVRQTCTQDLDRYPSLATSDGRTASPQEVCESARNDDVTRFCVDQWDKDRLARYGSFADCYHERQQQLRPAPKHPKAVALAQTDEDDDDDDGVPAWRR
jgi:hypothetical protein